MSSWLKEYATKVERGEIIVGDDLAQTLTNLMEDMASGEYTYDTSDAERRISFIESCVRLTKSPFYGKPMKLMLWQKAFIEAVYSFKTVSIDSGKPVDRFQEILLLIPRKNGKTELIAALQLAELILGRDGSDIVCSGTDDGTASLAYDAIDTMRLLIDPKSKDTWRNQKGISCFINNNHVYRLSASTRQREGRNIDVAGIDEVWSLDAGDDIYKVIQQSTSTKDDFKIFMFGSEGFVNDGFLDGKREEYRRIIWGENDTEAAKRKLGWIYAVDSEIDVWDTDNEGLAVSWAKANPSVGTVKKWSYLRDRVDEARRSKADRALTLTKDFNLKVADSETWLDLEALDLGQRFDIEDFRGTVCVGGVDLAETTDLTSAKIILQRAGNKTKYVHSMYWIPESKLENSPDLEAGARYADWAKSGFVRVTEGNEVDVATVADWFAQLYKEYGLRLISCGYDQKFASAFVKRMEAYGFDIEMVYQSRAVLSSPMRLVEADLRDGLINVNANPVDKWCLGNTSIKVWDTGHIMPVKIRGQASRRIDGAVSLIIGYEMIRRYRTELSSAMR